MSSIAKLKKEKIIVIHTTESNIDDHACMHACILYVCASVVVRIFTAGFEELFVPLRVFTCTASFEELFSTIAKCVIMILIDCEFCKTPRYQCY